MAFLKIGVVKEVKQGETRVALVPLDCAELVQQGHTVFIEAGAGSCAGFADKEYIRAGCSICQGAEALYAAAELVVKVKEPLESDLTHLKSHHTLFCFLHLAAEPALVKALEEIGLTAIAFETVYENGRTPLLAPMSAIAGRLAVQIGAWYLHAPRGGKGTLLGGIEKLASGHVVVIGAGVAGREAAILAHGMGANVTVLDVKEAPLLALTEQFPNMRVAISSSETLMDILPQADLLVGAVYMLGRRAPVVVSEEEVKMLPKGSVLVDISIDQGGCIATSEPCTHDAPVYEKYGVIHSAITNLPAAAPRTASQALSATIVPYVARLAKGEVEGSLAQAININKGKLSIAL